MKNGIFTKQFGLYLLKWQLGTFVAVPCMYLFSDYFKLPYWASVILFNFVGALFFYPVDKFIFRNKE